MNNNKSTRTISDSTKKKYMNIISKYPDTKYNYNEPEQFYNILKSEIIDKTIIRVDNNSAKIKETIHTNRRCGTIINILSAILWHLRETNSDHLLIDRYSKLIVNKKNTDNYIETDNNKATDNLKTYDEYVNIIKLYKKEAMKLDINDKKRHNMLKKYYIGALYTFYYPRRLQDYVLMKYIKNINDIDSNEFNYFVDSTGEFIFHKYKTASKYGSQVIKKEILILANELREYIRVFSIKPGQLLFPNETFIYRSLMKLFNTSVDGLRHAYIMRYGITQEQIINDSKAMNHSVSAHIGYLPKKNILK